MTEEDLMIVDMQVEGTIEHRTNADIVIVLIQVERTDSTINPHEAIMKGEGETMKEDAKVSLIIIG